MRFLFQTACVIAIAVGVGMLVAGSTAVPYILVRSGQGEELRLAIPNYDADFYHGLAIGLKGFGSGFLTLGVLGLVLPWIEVIIKALHPPKGGASESTPAPNVA